MASPAEKLVETLAGERCPCGHLNLLDLPICPVHGALTVEPVWITVAEVATASEQGEQ